jgi:diketogulonate reductase-like aldo/keto reductase
MNKRLQENSGAIELELAAEELEEITAAAVPYNPRNEV